MDESTELMDVVVEVVSVNSESLDQFEFSFRPSRHGRLFLRRSFLRCPARAFSKYVGPTSNLIDDSSHQRTSMYSTPEDL